MKVLIFGIFLKFNCLPVCYSVFQKQISLPEIYFSLLPITCAPKSYLPKVNLKLHLDGKLQVILVTIKETLVTDKLSVL